MDKLIEKIIEKTELKNWTLFLFIFAICYAVGLRLIAKAWFHLPDEKFNNTTLFLLEVFLSSLTITRFLVAIKFLEAINRTPIIADFINWVVMEKRGIARVYKRFINNETIAGKLYIETWRSRYQVLLNDMYEAWHLIHFDMVVEDESPLYKRCKEAVIGKTKDECRNNNLKLGYCMVTLNPALYRHLDKGKYGFWLQKRPFCLEHFILGGIVIPLLYYGAFYVHYLLLYWCDIILKWI